MLMYPRGLLINVWMPVKLKQVPICGSAFNVVSYDAGFNIGDSQLARFAFISTKNAFSFSSD
jgi:hypothetical protein